MSLTVVRYVNGKWRQNCYIVGNSKGDALIIDPGSGADDIAEILQTKGWRAKAIVNTHAHYDHIGGVADLVDRFDLPFYLHRDDADLLRRANLYRLVFDSRKSVRIPEITDDVSEKPSDFSVGSFDCRWVATPGHTPGSICVLIENCLFTGDTLMACSAGRTDLPGGDKECLAQSLSKLAELPQDATIYPGHGGSTSLADALAKAAKTQGQAA